MAGASTTLALPHPPRRAQGLTQATAAPWPGRCGGALGAGVPRHPSHGLRFPLLPHPPCGGPVGFRVQQARLIGPPLLHFGSRGQAVQKPRLMPLRTAQAVARQLQARHIGLVAVL